MKLAANTLCLIGLIAATYGLYLAWSPLAFVGGGVGAVWMGIQINKAHTLKTIRNNR